MPVPATHSEPPHGDDILYPDAVPFILVHLACFGAIWTGVTGTAVGIAIALYWLRMFAIGAGYHRYFSHRAYSTSRAFQFILALLAQSTAQKSVSGGPPSTATITCIPTPSTMSTRPATKASSTPTWAGFSRASMTGPTSPRSLT